MHTPMTDAAAATLADEYLKTRLARSDCETDPPYLPDVLGRLLTHLASRVAESQPHRWWPSSTA